VDWQIVIYGGAVHGFTNPGSGISYDDAAVAFGCNPQTMRQHYIALDEVDISDRVMEKIQSQT
jgi:hypothetical protein